MEDHKVSKHGRVGIQMLTAFNKTKQDKRGLIFLIARSCDLKMYGYYANRRDNALVQQNEVRCTSFFFPKCAEESDVPEFLRNNFYNLNVEKIQGSKSYRAQLVAFPQRNMTLELKKDSAPGKDDGSVASIGKLHLDGHIAENVQIFCIYKVMDFTTGIVEMPEVEEIIIYGCVKKTSVPTDVAQKYHSLSDSQLLIWEIMPITDDIRNRFNVSKLTQDYFFPKS